MKIVLNPKNRFPKANEEQEVSRQTSRQPNKRKTVKALAGAPLLPLLLAVNLERWMVLAVIIFSMVVVLVSIVYIYAILHERRRVAAHAHQSTTKKSVQETTVIQQTIVADNTAPQEQTYSNADAAAINTQLAEDPDDFEDDGVSEEGEEMVELSPEEAAASYEEPDPSLVITDDSGEVVEVLKSVDQQTGMALVVRYNKSFTAKYIQLSDESKDYYNTLKNYILSYKKVKSRISWKYDNIRAGKEPIARFAVRGKTLCLYMALNPDNYIDSKYKVERSESKKFEDVPCLYRIVNPRRVRYAMELIAELCDKNSLERGAIPTENYYLPYERTGSLIGKRLIREYLVKERYDDFLRKKNQAAKERKEREQREQAMENEGDDYQS